MGKRKKSHKKEEKTNVMRILDINGIEYNNYMFDAGKPHSKVDVAEMIGKNPDTVFKTLVTVSNRNEHFVFVIPINRNLNLKKAAKACGEKSIRMIKEKELLPLTGYVHGGCSPIGMKKQFPTFIDETVENLDTFLFSAGKRGRQVELKPGDLKKIIDFKTVDITD